MKKARGRSASTAVHWIWPLLALLALGISWLLIVVHFFQSSLMSTEAPSMTPQWTKWLTGTLIVLMTLSGVRWLVLQWQAADHETAQQASGPATAPVTEAERAQARREYVLEVISLGVTLDKFRQGKLWEALSRGHAHASIREQDPEKYPWSANEKSGREGGRANDTMENGAKYVPPYWGMPTFRADSPVLQATTSLTSPASIAGDPVTSGMTSSLFVAAGWELSERPDRLMERVFEFFDTHPDVPYVVVSAMDGFYFRDLNRAKESPPLIRDGHYVPERPDSSTLLMLARRERVDPLRPFAFEDFDDTKEQIDMDAYNREGFARRIFLAHLELRRTLPKPKGAVGRDPTTAEWLQETALLAKRPDLHPNPSLLNAALHKGKYPSPEFKPTPWFPIPWNKSQLAEFDKLPTLGFIHRPVFVKTVDAQGRPLRRRDARAAALAAGWQEALQTLPEAERPKAPARVVVATGGHTEQAVALHSVLSHWAEQGGPELDHQKSTEWIDTDARLGNTGAATWFMQMAIGVMGSYREGGISAALNLRDPGEASIVFISPPPEDKRQRQFHPRGGDVFGSIVGPAIDPANYTQ